MADNDPRAAGLAHGARSPIRPTQDLLAMNFDTGSPWYVAHTKPRQEAVAERNLQRQGFVTYLPRHTSWKKRRGAWLRVQAACFPRYLFFSPGNVRQGLDTVRSTIGVSALVRFGMAPATIGADVLAALHELEQRRNATAEAPGASPFVAGAAVCVDSGPLAGLVGIVAESSHERVAVMLSLLGREKRVVFGVEALRSVA